MCENECQCKSCIIAAIACSCGECYKEAMTECRADGVHSCPDYIKATWWRKLYFCVIKRRNKHRHCIVHSKR